MSPILQTLITLTLRILLRLLLLRQMPLTIRHHLAHVIDILLLVLFRIFLGVFLQDGDDFSPGFVPDRLAAAVVLGPPGAGGCGAAEPVLKFGGGHVDEGVEFSGWGVRGRGRQGLWGLVG